jgi:hypothetical protein
VVAGCGKRRGVFRAGAGGRAQATGKVLGTTGGNEHGAAVARPGQAAAGSRSSRSGLRMVHRRVRYARPQGREGAARRASESLGSARCGNSECVIVATDGDEETRVYFRTAHGGVASCSTSRCVDGPTTVGWSKRPVGTDPSPNDRRFLHRGNDRDILQRTQRPERKWLRVARRVHIEQSVRIERRICIERRRWRHQLVHPAMHERTAVQRIVRLTKQR